MLIINSFFYIDSDRAVYTTQIQLIRHIRKTIEIPSRCWLTVVHSILDLISLILNMALLAIHRDWELQ